MEKIPSLLPLLPIRNAVLFPTISMPLVVGRPRSLRALEHAERTNGLLVVVTQRILTPGDPTPDELYEVGTLCKIENTTVTDTGSQQVVVTGVARFRIAEVVEAPRAERSDEGEREPVGDSSYLAARGEISSDVEADDPIRAEALLASLKSMAREILEMLPGTTDPLIRLMDQVDDASYLTNVCAAYLNIPLSQKQALLETPNPEERMDLLLESMRKERDVLGLQREIRDKMSERLNKAQREALLREQLRTIRTELGEEPGEESTDEITEKLHRARLPEDVMKPVSEELKRLRALPAASAEYHVVRSYLEWIAAMPWSESTRDEIDLARARRVLDEDHSGLEQVKKRILQYLAVAKLKQDLKGPILCLVGPPGVGKTSLGQSIARALGRRFVRASLGGVRDEAEIRGHRRTYVGAMPGRILQSIRRARVKNPVMMLDEIDKLRSDFHGDPSAAMLEVLDPEQNKAFVDHYLDVPFDLSDVFFIATANVLDSIPPPLRDRMEIIDLSGYTSAEKFRIARQHLVSRELLAHGLKPDQVRLPDETLHRLVSHYTREAGVRELQRKIAALFRAAAEELIGSRERHEPDRVIDLGPERLTQLLGQERFHPEKASKLLKPGVVTGLAWTPHGGDLLFIESTRMVGKGGLMLTGQLGDVMKESAQIALSLARSMRGALPRGLSFDFAQHDLHIHVPGGAIPKDGPSAGLALFVSLLSLLTDMPVEAGLGMTGEITLRGAVLPVGGIKEKVLAAHRGELRTLILPRKNAPDLDEVPAEVRAQLKFVLVDEVEEALQHVFNRARPARNGGASEVATAA